MLQNSIKGKDKLSYETSLFLFTNNYNDINRALNSAREVNAIKPSERNKLILAELEAFAELNKDYYQEVAAYFINNSKK